MSATKAPEGMKSLAARADRIRVALARREEADQLIAEELRAAKDECGTTQKWLAWCEQEFGWGRARAYERLNPESVQQKRVQQREKSTNRGHHPNPQPERPWQEEVVYHGDPKIARRKALFIEMAQVGFKKLAFERHPDRGGSVEAMQELTDARDWGVEFITHSPLINVD